MRSFHLFLMVMMIASQSNAEGNNEAMTTAGPGIGGQFPHFGSQLYNGGNGGGVPAKISLRLIGKTFAVHNGSYFTPVDSFSYTYSNDRGGIPDNDQLDNDESLMYDEGIRYIYDVGPASYGKVLRRTQDFYPDNKVKFFTYANWKPAETNWLDSARYSYTYNNQKMVSSSFERWLSTTGWYNPITSDIIYSGQNVVAMESPVYKIEFSYDGNNNITQMFDQEKVGGQWFKKERHTYDYNGNNVIKHTLETWNSLANDWKRKKQWEYTYAGALVTLERESQWDGAVWVPVNQHTYAYDGNQNMITDTEEFWSQGNFVNESLTEWVYNGQDLPEVVTTRSWVNGNWTSTIDDKQYRFYYQNYFPTSVKPVAFDNEVSLYPVPASDVLTIDINWVQPEQFTVSLVDIKGSVLKSWKEQPASSYRKQIDVSQLPNANYFVTVAGESVQSTKRIVVSH